MAEQRFLSKVHDLSTHGWWARFRGPGTNSLLLRVLSRWTADGCSKVGLLLLHFWSCLARLAVPVSLRLYSCWAYWSLFSLATCRALSSTVRASPQRRGFQVTSNSVPPRLCLTCAVPSATVWPSSSRRHQWAREVAYNIIGSLPDSPVQ